MAYKKPAVEDDGKKKYDNTYMDASFNIPDMGITVAKLSLNKWQTPDGKLKRIYVSCKPVGADPKAKWEKLGWISADREEMVWGDCDPVTMGMVKGQAAALLGKM